MYLSRHSWERLWTIKADSLMNARFTQRVEFCILRVTLFQQGKYLPDVWRSGDAENEHWRFASDFLLFCTMAATPAYSITSQAYSKIVFHALKYPYAQVNGILLGKKEENNVVISDSVALFHSATLAPMLEVAMMQVCT
jgi:hypothetical protein